jgi:multidrug efflux pump subunit AcrA (membrane-fusion protein)
MRDSQETKDGDELRQAQRSALTGEKPPPRNWLWKPDSWRASPVWLTLGGLFIVLALLIIWLTALRNKPEEEVADAHVVSVRVARAERGPIAAEVTVVGTIFPREVATVSPKINAQIKSMPLLKNRSVHAGEVLATLEARDIQAQRAEAGAALEEAQASLRLLSGGTIPEANAQDEKALRDARAGVANARATYERRKALFERGGISQKDLEASQLALTTAENELRTAEAAAHLHQIATNPGNRAVAASRVKQAQDRLTALDAQLSYAVIRAPFNGVITDQFQYEGEYAAAGARLFTIADVSEVIVKVPVADTVAAQLKTGGDATVFPQELPGEQLTGHITLISRASDPQSRSVEVWVNLKNDGGRLRADSAAKVVVATQEESDAVIVPTSALTLETADQNEGVVMVVDGESVAHETRVTVGIRSGDRTQIVTGLQGNETVVVEGNYALPDETKVEVSEGDNEEPEGDGQ